MVKISFVCLRDISDLVRENEGILTDPRYVLIKLFLKFLLLLILYRKKFMMLSEMKNVEDLKAYFEKIFFQKASRFDFLEIDDNKVVI